MATVSAVFPFRRKTLSRMLAFAVAMLLLAACGGVAPDVTAGSDPELFEGRAIWISQCASCHGASGGGARGPKLDEGRVLERFPDAASQEAMISSGRGGMPSFAGRLSEAEIASVVRYTREVLTVVGP